MDRARKVSRTFPRAFWTVRVLGMRVFRVMAVIMVMIMPVVMVMCMIILHLQTAHAGTERIAQLAIRHIRARCRSALPLHMMVMAFLYRAYFILEP